MISAATCSTLKQSWRHLRILLYCQVLRTFYREGIRRLLKLKKNSNEGDRESADRQTEVRSTSMYQVCNDLRVHCLDDADKRALAAAKDNFKQARIKAVEAFSNEGVEILDRIQAMVIRVASTMLENVDHPEDALNVCIGCLEDLHGLKYVRETFNQVVYKGLNKGSFKRGGSKASNCFRLSNKSFYSQCCTGDRQGRGIVGFSLD